MAYLFGEQIQLGIGSESTRGTPVAPAAWIPARSPAGITAVVDKVQIKETRGTGIASQGAEIVQTRAEGELEFNVRNASIGYILKSLLGGVGSVTALGATTHTFTRQIAGPQNPALTLALAQTGYQHYQYPLAVVTGLELRTPIDDLVNATATFVAVGENAVSNYTPAFAATDFPFRHHDVTIKVATNVAGLGAAPALCLKEFSLNIANNSKPKQCIGTSAPTDIFSLMTEITGNFMLDYDGPAAFYNLFKANTPRAVRITMERDDLAVLGTSALYPKIEIDLPSVTFDSYNPERPLDDIVGESIDFTAHYSTADTSAITVRIQNTIANYN